MGRKHKYILFFIMLMLTASVVSATMPENRCYEVENPDYYKDQVYSSNAFAELKEWQWQLKNVTIPCHIRGEPISVILEYDIPQSYSPNKLKYSTYVLFSFSEINRTLSNPDKILEFHRNYKSYLEDFENTSIIKYIIQTTEVSNIIWNFHYFHLKITERENLGYDLKEGSILRFSLTNLKLIENLDLFIPDVFKIPQFEEFKKNEGIDAVEFDGYELSFYSNYSGPWCFFCQDYLNYVVDEKIFTSYSLDNDFEWETFPEISKAHSIIKEKLLVGEFSSCSVGTDDGNDHTIVEYVKEKGLLSDNQFYYITVPLKCKGTMDETGAEEKAFMVLHSDGTYEKLQIFSDYPIDDSILGGILGRPGLYILISIFIVILLALFKIIKAGKTGKNTILKPTKWKVITAIIFTSLALFLLFYWQFYDIYGLLLIPFIIVTIPFLLLNDPLSDILGHGLPLLITLFAVTFLWVYVSLCVFALIIGKIKKK